MGWASGSEIAEEAWDAVRNHIHWQEREEAARQFINIFEQRDCDTINECEQLVKDAGLEEKYWDEEE